MKTNISFGKRLLAMMLATVYVFAISTYIVFLASRTHVVHHHHHKHYATAAVAHLSGAGTAANFYDKQHGAFKSTFPNKRKAPSGVVALAAIAAFVMISQSALAPRFVAYPYVSFLAGSGRQRRLSLGVLRI